MKIAIHERTGSFSAGWAKRLSELGVDFDFLNAYDNGLISKLDEYDGFLWHWHQGDYRDQLIARSLLYAVERSGKEVFPRIETSLYFDDKVAQKYLLEALKAPLVESYVFLDSPTALDWARSATYPKVFKLKGGAGSLNVKVVKNYKEAAVLIRRCFNKGFPLIDRIESLKDAVWRLRRDKSRDALWLIVQRIPRLFIRSRRERLLPRQAGYAYFQDFIPRADYDDRAVVIGNRCFCIRRHCRPGDFRASGSGLIEYDKNIFPNAMIRSAFSVASAINAQSLALDYVYKDGNPVLIEVSYGFTADVYRPCQGIWSSDLVWHDVQVEPEAFIVDDFIEKLKSKKRIA
jgi:glutathione synthase/RimK-type ligase-like ATP-grasp enzyme